MFLKFSDTRKTKFAKYKIYKIYLVPDDVDVALSVLLLAKL